jgi:hypothetical protein
MLDSSLAISQKIKGAIESAELEAHISSSLEQFTEMVCYINEHLNLNYSHPYLYVIIDRLSQSLHINLILCYISSPKSQRNMRNFVKCFILWHFLQLIDCHGFQQSNPTMNTTIYYLMT